MPGLQKTSSRACVACGLEADSFCSRCGVTPYCSSRCQAKDWKDRHRSVCHNLARFSSNARPQPAEMSPRADIRPAPLRRPHFHREDTFKRNDDAVSIAVSNLNTSKGPRSPPQRFPKKTLSDDGKDSQQPPAPRRFPPFQSSNKPQATQEPTLPPVKSKPETPPVLEDVKPEIKSEVKPVVAPVSTAKASVNVALVNGVSKPSSPAIQPASLASVTPVKKMVPKNYLFDLLKTGDSALLLVQSPATECRTKGDYVCVVVHDSYQYEFNALCEDFIVDCDADKNNIYNLYPGDVGSYLNDEDGGWYRARRLNPTTLALIDSCKLVTVDDNAKIIKLQEKYEKMPEFTCVLECKGVEVGANLKCTILSKSEYGYKVELENVDTGAALGEGIITRWVPTVDYPVAKPAIPEVSRPALAHGSRVVLVGAASLQRAAVRPARAATLYDRRVHAALLAGRRASPVSEPPIKGTTVIMKYKDGVHYRALCKRTNVEKNKYLLEFIEYGNLEVAKLEDIYPCPSNLDLNAEPAIVSIVQLSSEKGELTPQAIEYVEKLADGNEEMILMLPNDESSAPSGSEVILKLAKNNEIVTKKIQEMCTPDWKKFEEKGGDVVEIKPLMFTELIHKPLPTGEFVLEVLDFSALESGIVSGCISGDKNAEFVFKELTAKMGEYCNSKLGQEPYLPMSEELCIAQCPPYPQWFRAVLSAQKPGAGGDLASIYYIDYGNIQDVPVTLLRKMLPEFITKIPAVAVTCEIIDFPQNVTEEMILKAAAHLNITSEGRGQLAVRSCENVEPGMCRIHAPELIAAMNKP